MNLLEETRKVEEQLAQRMQELIKGDPLYAYFSGRKELLLTLLREQESHEQQSGTDGKP